MESRCVSSVSLITSRTDRRGREGIVCMESVWLLWFEQQREVGEDTELLIGWRFFVQVEGDGARQESIPQGLKAPFIFCGGERAKPKGLAYLEATAKKQQQIRSLRCE